MPDFYGVQIILSTSTSECWEEKAEFEKKPANQVVTIQLRRGPAMVPWGSTTSFQAGACVLVSSVSVLARPWWILFPLYEPRKDFPE